MGIMLHFILGAALLPLLVVVEVLMPIVVRIMEVRVVEVDQEFLQEPVFKDKEIMELREQVPSQVVVVDLFPPDHRTERVRVVLGLRIIPFLEITILYNMVGVGVVELVAQPTHQVVSAEVVEAVEVVAVAVMAYIAQEEEGEEEELMAREEQEEAVFLV